MNKKLFIIIAAILIICIIGLGGYLLLKNNKNPEQNEIKPEEEISDEQMRQTIVTLYYQNKETKELMPEGRMVDSKTLLTDPYTKLIELLIEGPKNEKLQSVIPEGTRILKTQLEGDMVYLDLSKEFINNHTGGEEAENNTIYSIVHTLTELNEVNSVKILINGRENESFKDKKITFKNPFIRIEKNNKQNNQSNANKNDQNNKNNTTDKAQNTATNNITQNNNTIKNSTSQNNNNTTANNTTKN